MVADTHYISFSRYGTFTIFCRKFGSSPFCISFILMNKKPLKKVYIDIFVIICGFTLLGYLFKFPYLYIFSALALLSAIHPITARWVSFGWEKFGKFLGKINSYILLSLFYILFISPLSIIYRLTKKNKKTLSYWVEHTESVNFNKPY